MKKLMMIALCFLLVAALMVPALASDPRVVLVSTSKFTPGTTLTVDIQKMADMDARIREAYQDGSVRYQWYSGSNPVSGATSASYTIASSDKSIKVTVTCGDLVLTSPGYLVTAGGIVVTKRTTNFTTAPTTTKATTKASTTKTTTAPSTVSTTVPTTVPTTVSTAAPTTQPTAAPTTVSAEPAPVAEPIAQPAAEPVAQPAAEPVAAAAAFQAEQTDQAAPSNQTENQPDAFPWWTVILLAAVVTVVAVVIVLILRKKK